jgi:site-specific DNA-cytosine methylase
VRCQLPERVDILAGDAPCQPYSPLQKTSAKDPRNHPLFKVLLGDSGSLASICKQVLASYVITENVPQIGFNYPGELFSAKDEFKERMFNIRNEDECIHYTEVYDAVLDVKDFVEGKRPRRLHATP